MTTKELKDAIEQWQSEHPENRSVIAFTAEQEGHDLHFGIIVSGKSKDISASIADFMSDPDRDDVLEIIQTAVERGEMLMMSKLIGGEQ